MTASRRINNALAITILASFALAGCRSPIVSALSADMSVTVHIPGGLTSDVPATVRAAMVESIEEPGAGARYINPGTRYVTGALSYANGSGEVITIQANGTRADGQDSVELRFEDVPIGVKADIVVRLYDYEGSGKTLLGESAMTIDGVGNGAKVPTMSVAPIASEGITLGPYLDGTRGALIDAYSNGQVRVYSFTITHPGAYMSTLAGDGLTQAHAIFTDDGKRVPASRASSDQQSLRFDAAAGDYFAVAEIPSSYDYPATLSVDADVTMSLQTPAIYVDAELTVMDRKRPIVLSCTAGFAEGTFEASVSEDSVELVGNGLADGTYTISTPRTAKAAAAPQLTFAFADSLLGIERTGAINLPAQRTVVYVCPAADCPSWTTDQKNNLYWSASYITSTYPSEDGAPVIALGNGESITEEYSVNFNADALVVGGCGGDWSRSAEHGSSTVSMVVNGSIYALGVTSGGVGTAFYDLNLRQSSFTMANNSSSLVTLEGATSFTDCVLDSGAVTGPANGTPTYAVVMLSGSAQAGAYSFNRCSIVGGTYTPNASNLSGTLYGIYGGTSANAIAIVVANCLVDPGVFACKSDGAPSLFGFRDNVSAHSVTVVGSTVSSGTVSDYYSENGTATALSLLYGGTSSAGHVYNNLLIVDSTKQPPSIYVKSAAVSYGTGSAGTIEYNALSNRAAAYDDNFIIDPSYTFRSDIASTIGITNEYYLLSSLRVGGDYRPTADSFLTSGGVDLRTYGARTDVDMALGPLADDYFSLDLAGRPRSATTIGAWEL